MYRIFLVTCLVFGAPALVCAEGLTLAQCVKRGLEANPMVLGSRLSVDEADEGVKQAWGDFLPTLSLNYGHSVLDNSQTTARDTDYLSQQSDTLSLRLSQPLFSGFSGVAGLKRARHERVYKELESRDTENKLVRDIKTSFYGILQAEQLIVKLKESIRRLENQQKIAQAWVDQELEPQLRVLEVAVELANAEQRLANAEAELITAESNLKEWLAAPTDEKLVVDGSLQKIEPADCVTVDTCMDQAQQQRVELQLAELGVKMAREDARMIRARNLPRVSFDASWVDYEREYDNSAISDDSREYYTLGINFSMDFFQGGKSLFAYRKQKLAIKRWEQGIRRQYNTIENQVRSQFQQLVVSKSRLSSAVKGVDEAREAYKFADRAANLGVSSLDDLLSAELRLTQAEINKINAEYALQQARVKLDYVVGN